MIDCVNDKDAAAAATSRASPRRGGDRNMEKRLCYFAVVGYVEKWK